MQPGHGSCQLLRAVSTKTNCTGSKPAEVVSPRAHHSMVAAEDRIRARAAAAMNAASSRPKSANFTFDRAGRHKTTGERLPAMDPLVVQMEDLWKSDAASCPRTTELMKPPSCRDLNITANQAVDRDPATQTQATPAGYGSRQRGNTAGRGSNRTHPTVARGTQGRRRAGAPATSASGHRVAQQPANFKSSTHTPKRMCLSLHAEVML